MEKTTEDDSGLFELRVNLETCLEEIRLLIDRLDSKVDYLMEDVLSLSEKIDSLKGDSEESCEPF